MGHGTAFRIDPWSRCATAYHVLEDLLTLNTAQNVVELRPDVRLAMLEMPPFVHGAPPISPEAWRPLADSYAMARIEMPPLQASRLRNLTQLAVLRIRPSRPSGEGAPYLHVDLRRWRPRVGEQVMALGYSDLDRGSMDDDRPIAQDLWGAIGEIIDIEPPNGTRAHPWPLIRVASEWPGGMSGGPVFNDTGHVVGLVTTGIEGAGIGTATIFSPWNMPEQIFGSLDPSNPGYFRCHGVFAADGELIYNGQDLDQAHRVAHEHGSNDILITHLVPLAANS